ncbi:MAG: hypothetical protein ACRDDX_10290 [Cellulosilyticaceae bacterium]
MRKQLTKMVGILSIETIILILAVAVAAYMYGMTEGSPLFEWLMRL